MEKITGDKVYSLHPLPDGFLYSYLIEKEDNRYIVGYKMVSFETGKVSRVTKSIYMLTKFGAEYKRFIGSIKNYLTCFSIPLENGQTFIIESDGSATLFDTDGLDLWHGKMLYKDTAPGGVSVDNNVLWVSYPKYSVLIRYNLKTLREELRIGSDNSPLMRATGLFSAGSKLFICCKGNNAIMKMDTSSYQSEVYYQFEEPVLDYKFINKYEIAVLKSGIYLL
ncbi:MAG: hypothetical protein E7540_01100 [Ruminococcaceae bacterium]|nr:hypothetical protein [Oscillospiraceae bacterium]